MAYIEYNYGSYKKEIRKLLRRRLMVKERIRYHKKKREKWEKELPKIERELQIMLHKAEGISTKT